MLCEICCKIHNNKPHHKFSQNKYNRKYYGILLDDPINLQYVCWDCHCSHASSKLIIWNEFQFCEAIGIEPRSKQAKMQLERDNND